MRGRRDKTEGSIQDGRTWLERLYEWFSYPSRHGDANPSIDDKYPHIPQKVVIVTRMGTAMRGDCDFGRLPTPSVQHSACLSSAVLIVALPQLSFAYPVHHREQFAAGSSLLRA